MSYMNTQRMYNLLRTCGEVRDRKSFEQLLTPDEELIKALESIVPQPESVKIAQRVRETSKCYTESFENFEDAESNISITYITSDKKIRFTDPEHFLSYWETESEIMSELERIGLSDEEILSSYPDFFRRFNILRRKNK